MHTPLLCYILIETLFYNSISPNNYNRKCRTKFYKTAISARILSVLVSFLKIKRKKKKSRIPGEWELFAHLEERIEGN